MTSDDYTVEMMGILTGLKPSTIRAHIQRGNLKARKKYGIWLVNWAEAMRFNEENRSVGRPRKAR